MSEEIAVVPVATKCRVCGNADLIPCADIGAQYLSSVFPTDLSYRAAAKKYPLDMVMCKKTGENTCGLVQLGHTLDLSEMYNAYPYTSSTNSSMRLILQDVAESALALNHLQQGDTVLDIGGNDGTLLSFFDNRSLKLISIDPAQNVKPIFESRDVTYVKEFFTSRAYESVTKEKAKLMFSIAMFYHLDDPMRLAKDVAACMHADGVWVIQMAYLPAMLRTNMYDNIVHEHAGYYAAQHMKWLMDHIGLEIFDVIENDVYGGSFRLFVKKKGNTQFPATGRYLALLQRELDEGIYDIATYEAFMRRVKKTKSDLLKLCEDILTQGKTIWVYGASTKGNTILQYCGLGVDKIRAAADANPFKVGKYIIGSDIPIKSEEEMRAAKPDYLLALPYSFVDGFMKREASLVATGTRFIVPLPQVQIVE